MSTDRLFDNIFDSPRITHERLSGFAGESLNRIAHLDGEGKYTALAERVAGASKALQLGMTGLDGHVNNRKGKTGRVDAATLSFRHRMSELEGAVAYTLGGRDSEGYLALYPNGLTEYSHCRISQVPVLLNRVYNAAETFGDQLGADLKARLQDVRPAWHEARDLQEKAKGAVSGSRADRNSARHELEIALLELVHTIARDHAGNPEGGKAYFDFSLLEPSAHPSLRHKEEPGASDAD